MAVSLFELLQVSLGKRETLSTNLSEKRWRALYNLSRKHSIVGICYNGVENLPEEQKPPVKVMINWFEHTEYIKSQNLIVDEAVARTIQYFNDRGYEGVLLKGQGIAKLYDVLGPRRSSGDIDFLVTNAPVGRLIEEAHAHNPGNIRATYQHCDFGKIEGIDVELHWKASWFYSPLYNSRFQRFTKAHVDPSMGLYPSLEFNRVFILVHIFRHLFNEGIGLRQMLDYHMILEASAKDNPEWPEEKKATLAELKRYGMLRFTRATMYLLREVFGTSEECLLCEPSEKDGKFLLDEVMRAGNFGKHDVKSRRKEGESELRFSIRKIFRNLKYIRFGYKEVLFTPIWRLGNLFWRIAHNR